MGLVASAPIDTLFAPAAATPGAATGQAVAGESDLFATLLASLTVDAPIPDAGDTAKGLFGQPKAPAPANQDEPGEGAVSAAIAALQLLSQLTPILPGPLDGGQSNAGLTDTADVAVATPNVVSDLAIPVDSAAPADAPTGSAAATGADLPASPDAVASPNPAVAATSPEATIEAAAASVPTVPANPETGAPSQTPIGQQQATPATPATAASAATPATPAHEDAPATPAVAAVRATPATPATPPTETAVTNRIRRDEREAERQVGESPPVEAPPDGAFAADSVVRFDGNADNQGRRNGQNDSQKGDNQPNASVQGINHAAANSAVGQLRPAETTPVTDAPPPPPTTPTAPEAVAHVGRTIIEKVEQGGGEARLHLRPEALGEVTLHIRTEGTRVHVEIHAEQAEAANLLRDHTQDLADLLGDRGLNLADVHVDLGWNGAREQQQDGPAWAQRRQQAENSSFSSLMGLDEPSPADRHNRLRSAYNPDGAHSYRV